MGSLVNYYYKWLFVWIMTATVDQIHDCIFKYLINRCTEHPFLLTKTQLCQ